MDNNKRNVHNSGPLGMLVKSGQVKKVEESESEQKNGFEQFQLNKISGSYFKTQSGIEFTEHELTYVDPKECEPWKYANRQEDELGDIDDLVTSIKNNKQLQPALIRPHPNAYGEIKYEIIFGRRRHVACLKLGIPFLVIRKNINNIEDAIAIQDAENKIRNDVSNYSNAKLYQKLIKDGIFQSEKELAEKLTISTSSFNDLMAYAKIPDEVVKKIPDIHSLSKSMAVKLTQLLNKDGDSYEKLLSIAPEIGKTITAPAKLERVFNTNNVKKNTVSTKLYRAFNGIKLFTLKFDHRGQPCFVINKELLDRVDIDKASDRLSEILEGQLIKSGAPD